MRAFKKSFGVPVRRYLLHSRIQAAKSLLLYTDKSLLKVALEAGFTDQPAFNQELPRDRWNFARDTGEEQMRRCRRHSSWPAED